MKCNICGRTVCSGYLTKSYIREADGMPMLICYPCNEYLMCGKGWPEHIGDFDRDDAMYAYGRTWYVLEDTPRFYEISEECGASRVRVTHHYFHASHSRTDDEGESYRLVEEVGTEVEPHVVDMTMFECAVDWLRSALASTPLRMDDVRTTTPPGKYVDYNSQERFMADVRYVTEYILNNIPGASDD